MAGPGNLPLRFWSTDHHSTGRPVELPFSVTGRPVPTEPDPKQPKNHVLTTKFDVGLT
ncbi:hypothetical protein L484_015271 [Morus notabilis]|uniref:Uncharacterized protein n=1 Tax=Morus notabilis TaxID=981085 RepID=W9RTF3_9ROSA|nr:hypothetical protein L484_015271 [Morus notabilis]